MYQLRYLNSCSLSVNRKNQEQMRIANFIYFVNKKLILIKMQFWVLDVTNKCGLSGSHWSQCHSLLYVLNYPETITTREIVNGSLRRLSQFRNQSHRGSLSN